MLNKNFNKILMQGIARDFVSEESRTFMMKFGKTLASSLSGFIAGAIFASIIWGMALYFVNMMAQSPF